MFPFRRLQSSESSDMPKIDIAALKIDTHTGYPEPFRQAQLGRSRKRLGNAAGLDQFGVNLCRLKPGAASSQRHWHANEDELVYMLEGEVVLCEDSGETVLKPGPPPRSEKPPYSDIDMLSKRAGESRKYPQKSGEPYSS